jgi:hypothetical protein
MNDEHDESWNDEKRNDEKRNDEKRNDDDHHHLHSFVYAAPFLIIVVIT